MRNPVKFGAHEIEKQTETVISVVIREHKQQSANEIYRVERKNRAYNRRYDDRHGGNDKVQREFGFDYRFVFDGDRFENVKILALARKSGTCAYVHAYPHHGSHQYAQEGNEQSDRLRVDGNFVGRSGGKSVAHARCEKHEYYRTKHHAAETLKSERGRSEHFAPFLFKQRFYRRIRFRFSPTRARFFAAAFGNFTCGFAINRSAYECRKRYENRRADKKHADIYRGSRKRVEFAERRIAFAAGESFTRADCKICNGGQREQNPGNRRKSGLYGGYERVGVDFNVATARQFTQNRVISAEATAPLLRKKDTTYISGIASRLTITIGIAGTTNAARITVT